MMRTSEITSETARLGANLCAVLAELRRRFLELYGGRLVTLVLYGSQARGEAQPGSDIDLVVVLRGCVQPGTEVKRSGEILSEVSLQFDELVSCVFVSEEEFTRRNTPLLLNVRREGVVVA
jgi:predicted nucleotidyltransferase